MEGAWILKSPYEGKTPTTNSYITYIRMVTYMRN